MKKILFVSIMVFLVVSISFSQLGIKGGVNFSSAGGDDKGDLKGKIGLAGGLSYKIGLIAGLSIQPEVLYIQKGAIWENPFHKTTYSLNYIDVPVLVKFNLPIPALSPYIESGVSYGILISAKDKIEFTDNIIPSAETDIKELMSKGDLSLLIGVGFEISVLDINARYVIGKTKLYKDSDAKIYNRGIVLTAGIRF